MDYIRHDAPLEVPANKEEWCMAILNGVTFMRRTVVGRDRHYLLEIASSRFCFALHKERDFITNDILIQRV